jgi:ATP-dependent Clp protease adaptor protein ClpS
MSVDIQLDEKIKQVIKEPSKYKVVMVNDDTTPIDWVIDILMTIFKHSKSSAEQITLAIHNDGAGVAGIYNFEIAEQKSAETITLSRSNGFPLTVKLEESK